MRLSAPRSPHGGGQHDSRKGRPWEKSYHFAREGKARPSELSADLIPFTVLKLFSVLRTEEAFGLCLEELRFPSNAVIIEAKLAKLRQRRVPPILPNHAKWLIPFRNRKGPLPPGYSTPQAVQKAVIEESKKVGVMLKRNTFWNCYISYRVAEPTASPNVAAETGTSVRMIESNYKELATKLEAKRWYSIRPARTQMVELVKCSGDREWAINGGELCAMLSNGARPQSGSREKPIHDSCKMLDRRAGGIVEAPARRSGIAKRESQGTSLGCGRSRGSGNARNHNLIGGALS